MWQEGKKLGRPRRRWVDKIKMQLLEKKRTGVKLTHLAEDGDQWQSRGSFGF